jgi:GNAT superfamily N-acetyltransferase
MHNKQSLRKRRLRFMNSIHIVPAQPEHIEAAVQIAIAAWTPIREIFRRDLGDTLYDAFFTDWQSSKRRDVTDELLSGRGFVALDGNTVVGFIGYSLSPDGKIGTIMTNAVSRDYRGHGIGVRMYEFILNVMREKGAQYAKVLTGGDDGHAPARRAYTKAGFSASLPSVTYYREL